MAAGDPRGEFGGYELALGTTESFRRIDNVEQTYNGCFTPDSPEPGRDSPACVAGNPPPWALAP
jgi:hypothetical protein